MRRIAFMPGRSGPGAPTTSTMPSKVPLVGSTIGLNSTTFALPSGTGRQGESCGVESDRGSDQRHLRRHGRGGGRAGSAAPGHERDSAHRYPSMNLTRALEVALPEIPARLIAQTCPRLHPDVVFKEHIVDGRPTVRVFVPGVDAMFNLSPATWELVRFFDGRRSF